MSSSAFLRLTNFVAGRKCATVQKCSSIDVVDVSRQVVSQAGKTIAFCNFTELLQWQDLHAARFPQSCSLSVFFVCNALFFFLPLCFHCTNSNKHC